jgi:hypothetical protein
VPPAFAGEATPLSLAGPKPFVAVLELDELIGDPSLLRDVAGEFSADDDLTLLLRAPGHDPAALIPEVAPLLAAAGLDAPGSVDILALLDPVPPALLAPRVGAILTRRPPHPHFAQHPVAPDATTLRALTRGPLPAGGVALASS